MFSAKDDDDDDDDEETQDSLSDSDNDLTYEPPTKKERNKGQNNTLKFPNTIKCAAGVSPEKLGEITTNVLKDVSVMYPDLDPSTHSNMVVNRSKMRHQQDKVFHDLNKQQQDTPVAISWDGKRCSTLVKDNFNENKSRNIIQKQEHIVITDMENSSYIGNFCPEDGTGSVVAKGVTEKLKQKGFDLSKIFFICGDSTASNTGYGNGAFSWFEEFGMKAYHWVLCVSHLIELPLRKISSKLIGDTGGPGSFKRYN